ncbi:unnamed protein product [Phytophthora lilii]|uniref:Unnamed protein product n=1 Tax=Phytophthora lilii TaxID=2077276 RepID=A0A9W6WUY3_9STRA|nr:unnamed protein product [Phytophthora lilii]
MNHAPVLFSRQVTDAQASFTITAAKQQQHFSTAFLELLLACSSYEDIDVVQPTLEIWFFFLEDNLSQNEVSWHLLDAAGQDHVISVLSRLVNALIERCKYPQWFVETNRIVSDDPEIDAVIDLRSLFSKWPRGHEKPNGDYVSCVKGMSQMMADSKDIALIDALLFLLSYMVELFDVVSSDSESEDDPSLFGRQESGGMDVLLEALDCTLDLPMHPLVINGIARKYTTIEERAPLLQALLRFYCALDSTITQENEGDLLDVVFRVADGVSDAGKSNWNSAVGIVNAVDSYDFVNV